MSEINLLPDSISFFPGFADRAYFQDPETQEFWFHATDVCRTLGFKNVTSALMLHCDDDEKFQEIWKGKATWFVSFSGCIGLAMVSKTDDAKKFKRWLKHEVLPKLLAEGGYIMPNATQQQLEALEGTIAQQKRQLQIAEGKVELYGNIAGTTLKDFHRKLKVIFGSKFKSKVEHFCNTTVDYIVNSGAEPWQEDMGSGRLSDYYYPVDATIAAARQYLIDHETKLLKAYDEHFEH